MHAGSCIIEPTCGCCSRPRSDAGRPVADALGLARISDNFFPFLFYLFISIKPRIDL